MLSLFIGAVTMAMSESMEATKVEAEETNRLRIIEKSKMVADTFELDTTTPLEQKSGWTTSKEARQREKLKRILSRALDGGDMLSTASDDVDFSDGLNEYLSGWKRAYFRLGTVMETITESNMFINFVTAAILFSGTCSSFGTLIHSIEHSEEERTPVNSPPFPVSFVSRCYRVEHVHIGRSPL